MKYLKSLKLFLEEFEIDNNDSKDSIDKKQDLNKILKHISDYNSGKSKIDNILSNTDKPDVEIERELDKVIGTDDDKNTFLSQYKSAAKMKKSMDRKENQIKDKDEKIKSKREDIKFLSLDDEEYSLKKKSLDNDILILNKEKRDLQKEISDLDKEVKVKEKELKDKMSEKRKEIEDKIKNL